MRLDSRSLAYPVCEESDLAVAASSKEHLFG